VKSRSPKGKGVKQNIPSRPSKAKKTRRSRKKERTQNQKEAKRNRHLVRNRIAADKCRQKKTRWIDDLQENVHVLRADNVAKRTECEELCNTLRRRASYHFSILLEK
jgi:hypothetical protein